MGGVNESYVYKNINQYRSVVADGVKTVATLLNELYAKYIEVVTTISANQYMQITAMDVPQIGEMSYSNRYIQSKADNLKTLRFSGTNIWSSGTILIGSIYLANNDSHYFYNQKNSGADTFVNYDSTVLASGTQFLLRFNILEKI